MVAFLESLDFKPRRSKKGTSHIIYSMPCVEELINIQTDKNGEAKYYQVLQIVEIVKRYNLLKEGDDDAV